MTKLGAGLVGSLLIGAVLVLGCEGARTLSKQEWCARNPENPSCQLPGSMTSGAGMAGTAGGPCRPQCQGRACGPDGCGGQCGQCPPGLSCTPDGQCACVPTCAGKACGNDGCGGVCGNCAPGQSCQQGQCKAGPCMPDCGVAACGLDPKCGTQSCGMCPPGTQCAMQKCACVAQCAGKACGPDGCGGTCGTCDASQTCQAGKCTGPVVLKAKQIAAQGGHVCVVTPADTVRCWGTSTSLGYGNETTKLKPGPELEDPDNPGRVWGDVRQVAVGFDFTCALRKSGTVHCWGQNDLGQLGYGDRNVRTGPSPAIIDPLTGKPLGGVRELVTAMGNTCAVLNNGGARCWGANWGGQLGVKNPSPSHLVSPDAPVEGLDGVLKLVLVYRHACALVAGGGVRCWGANSEYELGYGDATPRDVPALQIQYIPSMVDLAVGQHSTCAVVRGGRGLTCWGLNQHYQLGYADRAKTEHEQWPGRLVSGFMGSPRAVQASFGPTTESTCVVLDPDGQVQCWGDNRSGQLGTGDRMERQVPGPAVVGLSGVQQLVGGAHFRCALLDSGSVRCWGAAGGGATGYGDTVTREKPGGELVVDR